MVWGPLIAIYLFLAGAGAGAFLCSAFIEARYPEGVRMRVAGRLMAPVFLGIGLALLMLDAEAGLHNPLRFFFLVSNPGSIMSWGVYFICVFMPVCCIAALLELLGRRVPRALTLVGCVSGLAVAAYTGFLLGVVAAYPLWNNAALPLLFVVSALGAGLASVSLVGLIAEHGAFERMELLKKAHLGIGVAELAILATMLGLVASGSPTGAKSVMGLVAGEHAALFWVGLVGIGLVAPLAIELAAGRMAAPKAPGAVRLAVAGAGAEGGAASGAGAAATDAASAGAGSRALEIGGQAGVLVGGFLLRLLVVIAALPVTIA